MMAICSCKLSPLTLNFQRQFSADCIELTESSWQNLNPCQFRPNLTSSNWPDQSTSAAWFWASNSLHNQFRAKQFRDKSDESPDSSCKHPAPPVHLLRQQAAVSFRLSAIYIYNTCIYIQPLSIIIYHSSWCIGHFELPHWTLSSRGNWGIDMITVCMGSFRLGCQWVSQS